MDPTPDPFIAPGSPSNSMILTRLMTAGNGRMPPLGSGVLDTQAIAFISRWITNALPASVSFTNWQLLNFGSTGAVAPITFPRLANRGFEVEWITNLFATNLWRALTVSQNRPVFAATNGSGGVEDSITNGPARLCRVWVYEP